MKEKLVKKSKIKRVIFFTLLIFIIIYFVVGNYFYNYALARSKKEFMENNPKLPNSQSEKQEGSIAAVKTNDSNWMQETPQTPEELTSFDGLRLSGASFVHEERNRKWVIIVHGYASNRTRLQDRAKCFFEKGFNVLSVDCRGCGESEGDYMAMGWLDRLDVIAWSRKIAQNYPGSEIVLYGTSMGGATVMMASGEVKSLPSNVKCIVEDCGYTSACDIFSFQLKDQFGLPSFPIMNSLALVTKIRAKFDIYEASSVEQLKKNQLPIMFIHGTRDEFVPFEMLYTLFESTNAEKDIYTVQGAGHNCAFSKDPDEYMRRVLSFIDSHVSK
ncbi:MAG: alpha/beta hydrolase [Oscillospiraceae bacterium]|jgi:fermentation-respiration switch protein FrsA (DUF1100 family)|nr:alpha/beta hydrolase [Oscillospiraceae bacterium]